MNILFIEKMLWILLGVYWLVAAFTVKRDVKKETGWERGLYILFWLPAFLLLFTNDFPFGFLYKMVLAVSPVYRIAGLALTIAGLLFSAWARMYLGRNWSGRITIKQDHELMVKGPYAITRNPIYTGLLFAFLGTALSENLVKGYLGIIFLFIGLMMKIAKEETFMKEVFREKYLDYMHKVKRLIPFVY